jgi:O-antigen/teichoic acid export membrane protein
VSIVNVPANQSEEGPGRSHQSLVESTRIRHRVVQAGGWALAGFAVDKGMAFLQLVVLARLLVPADFGLMAASAAVVLAAQTLSELGLEPAVVVRPKLTEEDLRVVWTLSVIRGGVLAVVLWAMADVIAAAMKIPELGGFLRVHSLGVFLQSVQSPALFVLLKQLDLRRRVLFDLSRRVVEFSVTIGLAWFWQSAWVLLGGQLTAFLFSALLSYWVAPCRVRWSLNRVALQSLWNYGRYQNFTAWFLFIVMSGGDFVVGGLLGVAALGLYQVAMALPTTIGIRAMSVVSRISLPTFAMLQNDQAGVLRALSLQMSVTSIVVVPSALGAAICAPYLIPILFGSTWITVVDPLRILCLFAIAAAFCSVMASFHCGANRPELQTRIWMIMCMFYVAVVIPFTLAWGLVGAAWALSLTFVLGLALHIRATVQVFGHEAGSVFEPLRWAGGLVAVVAFGMALSAVIPSLWMAQWLAAICGLGGLSLYGWHLWTRECSRLRMLWGA